MSSRISFTGGYLIMVEGDKPNGDEWFIAKDWQQKEFMKAMEFGIMKSMGRPHPITKTKVFKCLENNFNYRFIIHDDWSPVYLENVDTKKQREIKYIDLNVSKKYDNSTDISNISKLILG